MFPKSRAASARSRSFSSRETSSIPPHPARRRRRSSLAPSSISLKPPNGSSSSGNHDNPRRLEAVEPLMRLTNIHVLAKVTARRGRCRPQDHGQDPSPAALGGHPGLQQHRWQAPQEARLRTSRRQQDALQRLRSRSRPPVPVHPVGPEAIRVPRAARHQRGHEEARDDRAVQECGRQVGPGRHPGVRPRYDHDFRTDAIGVAMCG